MPQLGRLSRIAVRAVFLIELPEALVTTARVNNERRFLFELAQQAQRASALIGQVLARSRVHVNVEADHAPDLFFARLVAAGDWTGGRINREIDVALALTLINPWAHRLDVSDGPKRL